MRPTIVTGPDINEASHSQLAVLAESEYEAVGGRDEQAAALWSHTPEEVGRFRLEDGARTWPVSSEQLSLER
jgi:hypothetical protein